MHYSRRPLQPNALLLPIVVAYLIMLGVVSASNAATALPPSSSFPDPPTTSGIDNVTVLEDAVPSAIDLFPSFEDPEDPDEDLTFTIIGNTNAGLVSTSIGDAGVLTLTYSPNNFGSSTVTVRATDTEGLFVDAAFTVTVTAVNDAPSFTAGSNIVVGEDSGPQTFSNWASSISAGPNESGQAIDFVATPTNSFLFSAQPEVSDTGTLTFTPANGVSGVSTVTLVLTDNGGTTNGGVNISPSQSFTITITGANDPPTTTGISPVSVLEDAGNTVINLFAVFEDDEDRDEDLVYAVTGNTNSSLFTATTINQVNGLLTLDYATNANGSATLTVQATDTGGLSTQTSFDVTVTAVNDQPIFTKGADLAINDDAPFQSIPGWATNISPGADNESGQAISFSISTPNTSLFSVQPALSTTGTLTFQPQPNTSGVAVLTVLMFDDGGTANGGENTSAPQIFTITVSNANNPPTTTGIPDVVELEDSTPVSRSLFAAFNDVEDGAAGLTYSVESVSNQSLFTSGSPSIDPVAGTLTLTFAADAFGTSTVSIKATDSGGLSVTDQFSVTLNSVNDAPSFTPGSNITILEDSPAQSLPNWATNLSAGPVNEASQTLSFIVSNNNPTLFQIPPAISSTGLLSFTPNQNAEGVAVVTASIMDSGGTANGGINTSTPVNFTITITPQNDPPVVQPETYLLEEGQLLSAFAGGNPPGILDNDTDVDGDVLTAVLIEQPKFAQNWTFDTNGSFVYLHDDSENLEDTFTYQVSDGFTLTEVVTATIKIIASNDPPVAGTIDDVRVNEDAPDVAIPLYDSFEDPDDPDNTLLYSISNVSNPGLFNALNDGAINPQTGVLTLDFQADQNGTSTVTVQAQDPVGESAQLTFDVDVTSVNDPPTMNIQGSIDLDEDPGPQMIEGWATNIIAGPDNESNQTVTATITNTNPALFSSQPTFTINGTNGTLAFTPQSQVGGIAEVTITLSDNGGVASGGVNTNTYEFAITIVGDNDRPTATSFDPLIIVEDSNIAGFNLFDVFDDVEDPDSLLTYSIESPIVDSLFETVQITGTPAILNIALKENAYGSATLTIRATDTEGLWAQEDLNIDILSVNDPPSFTGGPDISVPQNSAQQTFDDWATNIQVGPENEQNQAPTFVVLSNDNENLFNTQPSISSDGTLSFEPSLNLSAFGTAQLVVALVDNGGTENGGIDQSATDTLNISLVRFNAAPTANNDNYIVDQGQSILIPVGLGVLANDVDPDGDQFRARLITPPVNGSLVLNSDGSFLYEHNNSRTTNDVFTYVANDGFVDSEVASVTISIQPLNTLFLQEVNVLEDSDSSIVDIRRQLFLNEDIEYRFELLSVSDPSLFSKATVDSLTGLISLVYAPNQHGFASLNIDAIPESGNTINATQNITIIPVNDPPIAVEDIFATRENTPFEINVLNNDVDFDNDALTIRSFSPPNQGTVTVLTNGSFLYSPPANFTGDNVTFSYVVQDDSLAADEGIVRITVFSGQFGVADLAIQQTTSSAAYNISNVGEVVGVTRSADGVVRAFSSEQDLFTQTPSEASAANDFGQVVGAASFSDPENPELLSISASRWDSLGLTLLGSFDGRSSKAFSINNEGRIVGTSTWNDVNLFRGFIWEDGNLKELETIDSNESQAFSINERGQVAGYEGTEAVIWNGERILRRLFGLSGRAYDVNENSQAAGSIDDGTVKAAFWDETGALTDIHVEGSTFSEAYGLNNSRWVVGAYLPGTASKNGSVQSIKPTRRADDFRSEIQFSLSKTAARQSENSDQTQNTLSANNNLRAFLWQGGTHVDLNDLIDPNSGWVLLEARGINNAAQISGIGLYNGEQQAFLLSPTNNKAPSAIDDIFLIDIIGSNTINLTSNDTDADGDSLHIIAVTQGLHGSVSITDASTVTYTPHNSFSGSDSFTYTIEDIHGASAQAEVSIEVASNAVPEENYLSQNYPNPFNPTTNIQFGLSETSNVKLEVFNLIGQHILTILDNERSAGNHQITFDATGLPGGVYIYRLQTKGYTETKKLIVLK